MRVWYTWWRERGFDEVGALDYFRRWGVDDAWFAWVRHAVWPALDRENDEAAVRKLEAARIIGRYDNQALACARLGASPTRKLLRR